LIENQEEEKKESDSGLSSSDSVCYDQEELVEMLKRIKAKNKGKNMQDKSLVLI